jgi:protein tyrosine phosphatase
VFEGLNVNLSVTIDNPSIRSYSISGLLSDTVYKFNVTAFTSTGSGSTGIGPDITLPVGPPPTLPPNVALNNTPIDDTTMITQNSIPISFVIPASLSANGPITRVGIIPRIAGSNNGEVATYYESSMYDPPSSAPGWIAVIEMTSDNQVNRRGLTIRQTEDGMTIRAVIGVGNDNCGPNDVVCNGPLRAGTSYRFKYRAYTTDNDTLFTDSAYSQPISTVPNNAPTIAAAILVPLIVIIIIVVLIIVGIVLFRKYSNRDKYLFASKYLNGNEELISTQGSPNVHLKGARGIALSDPTIVPLAENVIVNQAARTPSVKAIPNSRKVYLRDFAGYVEDMLSDSSYKFSEEYEKVSNVGLDHSKDVSLLPENRAKNRYTNILAYDHSRVKLDSVDDEMGTDYINANYIPGYRMRRAYIATQGPLPSTFEDFWRMVWEQNCYIIVMLTQLVERGRTKCHRYWPGSQPEVYDDICVDMISEKESTDWIIRKFNISKEKRNRMVLQYQFISWPDHGVPDTPTAALDFVQNVHGEVKTAHGPVIVHCSAGVGRTGTFIALGTLMQHVKDHDWVDIFGLASEMRQHRNHMIQTEAQYVFIHKAMLEVCAIRNASKPLSPIYGNSK